MTLDEHHRPLLPGRGTALLVAGVVWVLLGGFLAGHRLAAGGAGAMSVLAALGLPMVAATVWREGARHAPARRRLDVLVVGGCVLLWLVAVLS